jgi:hypothetical protein
VIVVVPVVDVVVVVVLLVVVAVVVAVLALVLVVVVAGLFCCCGGCCGSCCRCCVCLRLLLLLWLLSLSCFEISLSPCHLPPLVASLPPLRSGRVICNHWGSNLFSLALCEGFHLSPLVCRLPIIVIDRRAPTLYKL